MTDEKFWYKILSYIAVGVVVICFLFVGFGAEHRELSRLQNDTDSTVGNIKANSAIIGVEVGRSQDSIGKSKEALERVESEIGRSREISCSIEAGVAELERLIGEAQVLVRRSAEIIERVDTTAQ